MTGRLATNGPKTKSASAALASGVLWDTTVKQEVRHKNYGLSTPRGKEFYITTLGPPLSPAARERNPRQASGGSGLLPGRGGAQQGGLPRVVLRHGDSAKGEGRASAGGLSDRQRDPSYGTDRRTACRWRPRGGFQQPHGAEDATFRCWSPRGSRALWRPGSESCSRLRCCCLPALPS
jgi:hypothetical protein